MSKKPTNISASHILIMHSESKDSRSSLSKTEAKKEIDRIYDEINNKNSRFVDLATKHSDCSSSSYGGSLGEFGRGMMVKAFEDVAFALNVEEVSKPFESEFGYHIVKRDK